MCDRESAALARQIVRRYLATFPADEVIALVSRAPRAVDLHPAMFRQFQGVWSAPGAVRRRILRGVSLFRLMTFRRCKSKFSLHLQFVPADHCVADNSYANQRQWDESEPDLRAGEILRSDRANLRADHRAGMHDERDQNIHVTLDGVSKRSITG